MDEAGGDDGVTTAGQVTVRSLTGVEIHAAMAYLAALRIAVFATFPYLYDGDAAYEAHYLAVL